MVTHLKSKIDENSDIHNKDIQSTHEGYYSLSHMEKMASIGQLSFSVAHEMRNLLGMIRNAAFNIDRSLQNSDITIQNNMEVINRSINRAREFIDNILDLSRVSNRTEEAINVPHLIDNLLSLFSKEMEWRNIELEKEYNSIPLYLLDRNALQECFVNIILNAIQSIDNGGTITIVIKPWEQGISIAVTDTGCGIPEDVQDKIFNRFYTTKKDGQGTGLGLTIARNIARDIGGDIHVQSQAGMGSTFSICLPSLVAILETQEKTS